MIYEWKSPTGIGARGGTDHWSSDLCTRHETHRPFIKGLPDLTVHLDVFINGHSHRSDLITFNQSQSPNFFSGCTRCGDRLFLRESCLTAILHHTAEINNLSNYGLDFNVSRFFAASATPLLFFFSLCLDADQPTQTNCLRLGWGGPLYESSPIHKRTLQRQGMRPFCMLAEK